MRFCVKQSYLVCAISGRYILPLCFKTLNKCICPTSDQSLFLSLTWMSLFKTLNYSKTFAFRCSCRIMNLSWKQIDSDVWRHQNIFHLFFDSLFQTAFSLERCLLKVKVRNPTVLPPWSCGGTLRPSPSVAHLGFHPKDAREGQGAFAMDVHHFLNAPSRLMGFEALRACWPDGMDQGTHGGYSLLFLPLDPWGLSQTCFLGAHQQQILIPVPLKCSMVLKLNTKPSVKTFAYELSCVPLNIVLSFIFCHNLGIVYLVDWTER